ncbi:MAG: metabolite traffic protein EboE [Actinomycetota bacterium]
MRLPGGLGHLTYCTNIHPGESWADCFAALARHLPAIKRQVSPRAAFGVGLRLSAAAAATLSQAGELERFRAFLAAEDLYVFTINGFPYGAFHRTRVKEAVYRPDWRQPERRDYTARLAEILAALLPDGIDGSISTVPGAWAADLAGEADVAAIVAMLQDAARRLAELEARTGRRVTIALEPEPGCQLATTDDVLALFRRIPAAARRHIGVCLDLCHLAVEFEDPVAAVAQLQAEEIPIFKVQISAGLALPPAQAQSLRPFDDGVYLHQVAARGAGGILRFADLADAWASAEAGAADEWRVHFHVPLWAERLERLSSTAGLAARLLAAHAARPVCEHLEVETYTWDVLAPEHRTCGVEAAIVKELLWVRDRLGV